MRLISAKQAEANLRKLGFSDYVIAKAIRAIRDTSTIDAVEVVRCKNCIHYDTYDCDAGFGWCKWIGRGMMDEHHCYFGRKKESR